MTARPVFPSGMGCSGPKACFPPASARPRAEALVIMVQALGFEPRLTGSEPGVLPLDDA